MRWPLRKAGLAEAGPCTVPALQGRSRCLGCTLAIRQVLSLAWPVLGGVGGVQGNVMEDLCSRSFG